MPRLLALLLLLTPALAQDVSRENLERHVRALAGKEMEGRRGEGARRAALYVKKELEALGLPARIREHDGPDAPVRNVVAVLQAGEEPSAEHVIVSAHYDHLGRMGGFVFPGAADNAAGVAALLEIARVLRGAALPRDVVLVAFDQEEFGFRGSRAYVTDPVRPLGECALFVTMDILGRDLADATRGVLFCVGLEHSDTLYDAVAAAPIPEGISLAYAGADIVGPRSDFVPFHERKVPFLFFSAGEYVDYHCPTDTPERVDFAKLHRETEAVLSIVRKAIAAPRPRFVEEAVCRVAEPATLERVIAQLLAKRDELRLSAAEAMMGEAFRVSLEQIAKSGSMTKPQRAQIVATCRMLVQMLQQKR